MRIWIHFVKAPIRVTRITHKRSKLKLQRQMLGIKLALAQEKSETKEMLTTYRKYTMRQATSEEMIVANKQFIDLLKGVGLGVFAVLPFAPITIPVVIKVGRWVGVEILPSSFSEMGKLKKNNKKS
ncbi:MAG: hypothetical protein MJK12_08605 [Colwellia sp.]|nr:hypothetical protein [Colwellia sp.]